MRQPSNREFKYPVLFDPKFPNLVKEVPISTLKNKIKAMLKNNNDKRVDTTLDCNCHPQPTAWPRFLKMKVRDKRASMLNSTPNPNTKP